MSMPEFENHFTEESITIGEMARKLNVTVRTLQYYDKEGLLTPSATTKGGRRFYTKKDLIKLHQILSMKYLGFTLDDIKNRLSAMHSPQDVARALELQKLLLREQMAKLGQALSATEALQQEVEQMQTVDFDRYAKIIVLLRQKSDSYWLLKLFNDKIAHHVNNRFSEKLDAWATLFERWKTACDETILQDEQKENPESDRAQALAAEWWSMTLEFCGNDLSLISEMNEFEKNTEGWSAEMKRKIPLVQSFRHRVLEVYLKAQGMNL